MNKDENNIAVGADAKTEPSKNIVLFDKKSRLIELYKIRSKREKIFKAKSIICTIIMYIVVLLCIMIWTILIILKCNHKNFKPKATQATVSLAQSIYIDSLTQQEAIDIVNKEFDNTPYNLHWTEFDDDKLGLSEPIVRGVWLDKHLDGIEILYVLTHELIHTTELVANEAYTEYRTFVRLYESNDDRLHQMGIYLAYQICVENVRADTKYECSYYIVQYLIDNNSKAFSISYNS